ncbi:GGDEF domain-containing protein, partial [Pseudomonas sp. CCC2.2]
VARRGTCSVALLFLDLNDFKGINDVHGHAAGDRVLCAIARRIEGCVRETDTVARIGGDEFVVLLTGIQSREAVSTKVQQILSIMDEPLDAEFHRVDMPSCSIGVA